MRDRLPGAGPGAESGIELRVQWRRPGTGAAVLHTPSEVKLHFVVVRHGTEIHQVVDSDAVTTTGIKVE